jgi:hypothetical protein
MQYLRNGILAADGQYSTIFSTERGGILALKSRSGGRCQDERAPRLGAL